MNDELQVLGLNPKRLVQVGWSNGCKQSLSHPSQGVEVTPIYQGCMRAHMTENSASFDDSPSNQ